MTPEFRLPRLAPEGDPLAAGGGEIEPPSLLRSGFAGKQLSRLDDIGVELSHLGYCQGFITEAMQQTPNAKESRSHLLSAVSALQVALHQEETEILSDPAVREAQAIPGKLASLKGLLFAEIEGLVEAKSDLCTNDDLTRRLRAEPRQEILDEIDEALGNSLDIFNPWNKLRFVFQYANKQFELLTRSFFEQARSIRLQAAEYGDEWMITSIAKLKEDIRKPEFLEERFLHIWRRDEEARKLLGSGRIVTNGLNRALGVLTSEEGVSFFTDMANYGFGEGCCLSRLESHSRTANGCIYELRSLSLAYMRLMGTSAPWLEECAREARNRAQLMDGEGYELVPTRDAFMKLSSDPIERLQALVGALFTPEDKRLIRAAESF